jgi:hypothetical protein
MRRVAELPLGETDVGYLAWAVWLVAAVLAGAWNFGVRHMARSGSGITLSTVTTTIWWTASVVAVAAYRFSPFHLLWLFPVGFLVGFLCMMSPFAYVLQPIARLYARILSL